ncbi:MAG TPA: hypothetical protein VNV25_25670 [Gemmatimonadaceae bacterium]|jgi:hypothetical protein|nr:hypothetical protein [Gemmatimonadaceae bacterium]
MNWTALSGGLVGALAGALAGGGIAYAATDEGKHATPTLVAGALGGAVVGLGGAMLGKKAKYNRWNAANQACPAGQVADYGTLQCVAACPDDSIPTNGACTGLVPSSSLFGAGGAPERLAG